MIRSARFLFICLALMLGFTTVGITAAQATASATGSVYSNDTGDPLSGVTVKVHATQDDAEGGEGVLETAASNSDGSFTITQDDGEYWLTFEDPSEIYAQLTQQVWVEDGSYLGEFYMDLQYGTISGSVVDKNDDPLTDECTEIEFYNASAASDEGPVVTVYSDEEGNFSTRVQPGSYKVHASHECDDFPAVWVGGADLASASEFVVEAEQETVIPAIKISDGAAITGIVLDSAGLPIRGILVQSFASAPEEDGYPVDSKFTSSSGRFTLEGHTAGTSVRVQFSDLAHEYVGEWYDDAETFGDATAIDVSDDTTITLDNAQLDTVPPSDSAKVLSGKVVDKTGAGVFGIRVTAEGPSYTWTTTRRDGTYSFIADDLEPGTYRLSYQDDFGMEDGDPRYLEQYYLGKTSWSTATPVVVTTSARALSTVKLIGFGKLSGKISIPSGFEESYLWATVYNADDEAIRSWNTAADGTFTATGLEPGSYKVRFEGWGWGKGVGGGDFISQWFKNKSTYASSNAVVVNDLATTGGVNALLTDRLTALVAPKISGTAKKGKTLKSSLGTWNRLTHTVFTYQWYRGSSAIKGATKSSYKLTSSDVGKTIKVRVSATNKYDHFHAGSSFSKATSKVKK